MEQVERGGGSDLYRSWRRATSYLRLYGASAIDERRRILHQKFPLFGIPATPPWTCHQQAYMAAMMMRPGSVGGRLILQHRRNPTIIDWPASPAPRAHGVISRITAAQSRRTLVGLFRRGRERGGRYGTTPTSSRSHPRASAALTVPTSCRRLVWPCRSGTGPQPAAGADEAVPQATCGGRGVLNRRHGPLSRIVARATATSGPPATASFRIGPG